MQKRYWQFYKNGISILLMGVMLWACSGNQQKGEEDKPVPKTEEDLAWESAEGDSTIELPLNQQADMLFSTIQEYQQQAFASEQVKVNNSQSLIDEIEQSMNNYNRKSLDSIKKFLALGLSTLYTDETMANLETMTKYDEYTESLIKGWKRFREQNDEFDNHARAIAFYEDIMRADGSDQGIRANYNAMVHDYNKLLREKGSELATLGEQYTGLEPFLFFYGEDPVTDQE